MQLFAIADYSLNRWKIKVDCDNYLQCMARPFQLFFVIFATKFEKICNWQRGRIFGEVYNKGISANKLLVIQKQVIAIPVPSEKRREN